MMHQTWQRKRAHSVLYISLFCCQVATSNILLTFLIVTVLDLELSLPVLESMRPLCFIWYKMHFLDSLLKVASSQLTFVLHRKAQVSSVSALYLAMLPDSFCDSLRYEKVKYEEQSSCRWQQHERLSKIIPKRICAVIMFFFFFLRSEIFIYLDMLFKRAFDNFLQIFRVTDILVTVTVECVRIIRREKRTLNLLSCLVFTLTSDWR